MLVGPFYLVAYNGGNIGVSRDGVRGFHSTGVGASTRDGLVGGMAGMEWRRFLSGFQRYWD